MTITFGCASRPEQIDPAHVSPVTYKGLSCDEIESEARQVLILADRLAAQVDDRAQSDDVKLAIGLFLFFPPIFFLEGDGPEATQYARLQGEYIALRDAASAKQCTIEFMSPNRFDGEWVLRIDDLIGGGKSGPVQTPIINNGLRVSFDTRTYTGELQGVADERGSMSLELFVTPREYSGSNTRLIGSATYSEDGFSAEVSGWVVTRWQRFSVTLTDVTQNVDRGDINLRAGEEAEIALLSPQITSDTALKEAITQYFNDLKISKQIKRDNSSTSPTYIKMFSIGDMTILSLTGHEIEIGVHYWWGDEFGTYQRSSRGIATVKRDLSSYRVLNFRIDGRVY